MLIADMLNPPIQYNRIWFIIGCILITTIPVWYGLALWLTRRRPIKSLDRLKRLPVGAELDRLKAKYLKLIDESYARYQRDEIKLRALHGELSLITRYFVYEAKHFPAPFLTLADFILAPYPVLTKLIGDYYPKEFARTEHGDAAAAVESAKGLVRQWL